jgi:hypothetical protein
MASPTARREGGKIIIEIPEENVILGVEGTPRDPVKVIDREAFLNAIADRILEFEDGSYDAPLFFKAIEMLACDMAESAEEFVEPA